MKKWNLFMGTLVLLLPQMAESIAILFQPEPLTVGIRNLRLPDTKLLRMSVAYMHVYLSLTTARSVVILIIIINSCVLT